MLTEQCQPEPTTPIDTEPIGRLIPYPNPKRSKLYQQIKTLIQPQDIEAGQFDVDLSAISKAGYAGSFTVTINPNTSTFESDFANKDISRFPARIRACALALKELGLAGKYVIAHRQGIVSVTLIR